MAAGCVFGEKRSKGWKAQNRYIQQAANDWRLELRCKKEEIIMNNNGLLEWKSGQDVVLDGLEMQIENNIVRDEK